MDIKIINKAAAFKHGTAYTKRRSAGILAAIILTVTGLCVVFPMMFTVVSSLESQQEINKNYSFIAAEDTEKPIKHDNGYIKIKLVPDEVTFMQYYTVLIKKFQFVFMFFNSVKLVLPIVIGQVAVGLMTAYGFAASDFKLKEPLFYIYIVVMLMPFQVTLVPNYIIADKLNLIGSCLSIILPGIFSPFGVFLMRQYMSSIPTAYMEAAKIDGAGHWRVFSDIYAPMCKGGMAALFILSFMDNWNMVEQPLIFINDAMKQPLSIYLSEINKGDTAIAFAASVIYMVPMLLIFLYGEDYLYEGIQMSGIKG